MIVHGVMVVWGEAYTTRFLEVFLPSFLSAGNLPALRARFPCRFMVYTTPADASRMTGSPLWRILDSLAPVDFIWLDAVPREPRLAPRTLPGKYRTLAACHHHAMARAAAGEDGLLLLGPDTLVSDGALDRVAVLAEAGWRGLFLNHLSVLETSFRPALEQAFPGDHRGVRSAAPRELARLALEHLHPWMDGLYLGDGPFQVCSQMYWRVPGEGHVAHAWHLSPLFVRPQRLPSRPFLSADNDYSCQVIDDPATLRVPGDSDQVCFLELLPARAGRVVRPQPYPFSPLRFALAAEGLFPSPHSACFVRQGIRWHGSDTGPRWAAVEQRARTAVEEVLAWMDLLEDWPGSPEPGRRQAASAMAETLAEDIARLERHLARGGQEHHPGQLGYLWANLAKLQGLLGRTGAAQQALERQLALCRDNPAAATRIARRARALGLDQLAGRAAAIGDTLTG